LDTFLNVKKEIEEDRETVVEEEMANIEMIKAVVPKEHEMREEECHAKDFVIEQIASS